MSCCLGVVGGCLRFLGDKFAFFRPLASVPLNAWKRNVIRMSPPRTAIPPPVIGWVAVRMAECN